MTSTRFGFFVGDSHGADFLAAADFDPDSYPTISQMKETFDVVLLPEIGGKYIIFADAKEIKSEEEYSGEYYSLEAHELADQDSVELPTDELEAFKVLMKLLWEHDLEPEDLNLDAAVADYEARVTEARELAQANAVVEDGTLVFADSPAGAAYRASEPVAFNRKRHDARSVLLASAVDYTASKGAVDIYPLPPGSDGKFWGEFKGGEHAGVYFVGQTKDLVEAKAAIHLAWAAKHADS